MISFNVNAFPLSKNLIASERKRWSIFVIAYNIPKIKLSETCLITF